MGSGCPYRCLAQGARLVSVGVGIISEEVGVALTLLSQFLPESGEEMAAWPGEVVSSG